MRTRRGFTIIEALIAIVILIGVVLAMVGLVPTTFQFANRDSQRMEATAAAQQYLDALRHYVQGNGTNSNLPAAPNVAIDLGDQFAQPDAAVASPGNFTLTNNGCPLLGVSTRMYDCVSTATWTYNGETRSVSLESYVTAQN